MRILETNRLVIKQATVDDTNFFYRLLNSANWLKHIGDRGIRSEEDAQSYIEDNFIDSYREHGYGLFKMMLKSSNVPIGVCGFVKRDYLESADIGFAILPECEGQGYTLEAAKALMHYGRTVLKLRPILAITTDTNSRSRALLTKIGLRETGTVKPNNSETEFLLYSDQ
ncbi:GNAT family N-acetyltransferase [Tunicatimonas pelagia]|uniref:GNAT family N-acetyltransferase n=1 Tax=Tunicatimonas pelagia TaxID=931531 RepID=UPI002666B79C|nr:GNAT family N-acetyltransferase [Tunicatimonas pelagia]WKN40823.1 GNAT family N-acetyltransferase [Tunicatimonas pelagia]